MKDTEDYINIELDSSQNRLFRLDIVLTAAAFSMEIFHVMGGLAFAAFPRGSHDQDHRASEVKKVHRCAGTTLPV